MSEQIKTPSEGGVDAPTRHPIDWRSEKFWDQHALERELERVYDICHGCRRCVSLCQAFPTLFDLVDESPTLEVDGVDKADYHKVVDQCYLCDLCFQTKCPYVPPHEWEVDFPHLMLRAKALQFRAKGAPRRQRFLTNTEAVGKLGRIPVAVKLYNKARQQPRLRRWMEKSLGIHHQAAIPPLASPPLKRRVAALEAVNPDLTQVKPAGPTRGRVALFATCYGHQHRPQLVQDLACVLQHNGVPVRIVADTVCCGMPKMELGDLDAVARNKAHNIEILLSWADQGWDILTPVPSCTLMFRQELPLLFADEEAVDRVRGRMFDPFEYLVHRHKAGLLKTEFKQSLGPIAYHAPCHQRVQNIGSKTKDVLNLIPGVEVHAIERCSGHDGTYGVRRETYPQAAKIAAPVVRRINQSGAAIVSSDCPMAADHLAHLGQAGTEAVHPISLLRRGYGL